MLQSLKSTVLAVIIMTSSVAYAGSLEADMQGLAKNYTVFMKSNNSNQAKQALSQMKQYALDSKQNIPDTLTSEPDNSPEIKAYDKMLDQLVVEVDRLNILVDRNLQQAQQSNTLMKIKEAGHKAFK
ncbi:cytochrome b562 [Acinetobacter rathckeae]|uniref:cytochrome b562 n=1 Tax=Acinetobacter rathckeae TaxID=2605272 RepID=UPI0018A2B7F9|nr:cytochrome b562 [Acinetobacter rathckeae]MBF7689097.1 ATP-binding protein [Acinetobacter rathckeae]MBF7696663.1 ATP-binding protein [Acinetobacter rathckeae]